MISRRTGPLVALLVMATGGCALGRDSRAYQSFVASHDAIQPGMSIRQLFDAGLADYLSVSGGSDAIGGTVPEKEPVSAECRRHLFEVAYGSGDFSTRGGFGIRVYCNMNGPSDRQVTPESSYENKQTLLQGLETYAPWAASMRFRVESPALQIGGVYDSYEFSTGENGNVATVAPIVKASN